MSDENAQEALSDLLPRLKEMLARQRTRDARAALIGLMDPEVADVIVGLEPQEKAVAFRILPKERAGNVFAYLAPEEQEALLHGMQGEQLAQLLDAMQPDDRAELFEELPGQVAAKLLALMRPEERKQTQTILGYAPESVGRLMTPDYITLRPGWTVHQALEYLRSVGKDAETLHTLYVVDDGGRLLDDVRLRQLVLADPAQSVESLMDRTVVPLRATADREEAVRVMERYDRPVLPVVDRDQVLVGIVTFDDVADVAEAEATEDIQKMGAVEALDEPYAKISLLRLVRKRGVWLSILFVGEMLTTSAMSHFQDEVQRAAVLAMFIPLIISSGGNSGSQASTLIIRALAVGEIRVKDWWRVFLREVACGCLLGLLLAAIGWTRIHVWQWLGWGTYTDQYQLVALTVAVALVGVVLWGSLMGSMLPFMLRAVRLDPAAISAPFVATCVDVTGLVIYFTVAFVILKGTLL
jgi:magnesium transporter